MAKQLKATMCDWYQGRSWDIFVSLLAVLAMCWLTTLIFTIFFCLINDKANLRICKSAMKTIKRYQDRNDGLNRNEVTRDCYR